MHRIADAHGDVRPVGDQRIDAPLQQAFHFGLLVHRPDLDPQTSIVGLPQEPGRHDAMALREFGNLEATIRDLPGRPPDPAPINRHADLHVAGARRHLWKSRPRCREAARAIAGRTHPARSAGTAHIARQRVPHFWRIDLHLDYEPGTGMAAEDFTEGRDARRIARIDPRQLSGRSRRNRPRTARRPIERLIMMDNDDTVGGQMNVQLQAVGTGREPAFEGRVRIFRPQGAAAAMSEDQGMARIKERHKLESQGSKGHDWPFIV
jgi:hypothetical protein